jgi:hypothetical protein
MSSPAESSSFSGQQPDESHRVLARSVIWRILVEMVCFLLFGSASLLILRSVSPSGVVGGIAGAILACSVLFGYFKVWILLQLCWNVRFRSPLRTRVSRVVGGSSEGDESRSLTQARTLYFDQIHCAARVGRTTLSWVPSRIIGRNGYLYGSGRYSIILSDGPRPVVATLQSFRMNE